MAGGEFVALAHGFPEHPKVMELHDRAFRFHIVALDYCSRNLTDGHVSSRAVKVVAAILDTAPKRWTKELVDARLWRHDEGGDGFWIHDYLTHNPRADAIKELRDKRRQAGIRGAEKRWAGKKDKPPDSPSNGKSHSNGHGTAQIPAEQSSTGVLGLDPGRSSDARAPDDEEGLPFENVFLTTRLLSLIGDDADGGTRQVIHSYARQLPQSAFAKVIESLESNHPRDRAAYAVAALRDELDERRSA